MLYQNNIQPVGAGIYYNPTAGLISLSSDGTTWTTMADKNLGATQVYNDGDELTQANCGKLYQWGNNYGFPRTGAILTSTTRVDASSYGPGNYYSSNRFIKNSLYWDSSENTNLWGGDTGTFVAMRGPCEEGWHIMTTEEIDIITIIIDNARGGDSFKAINAMNNLHIPPCGARNPNTADPVGGGILGGLWSSYYRTGLLGSYEENGSFGLASGMSTSLGLSIRPVKNEPVIPDNSWIKIF